MNHKGIYFVVGALILFLLGGFFIFDGQREVLAEVNDVQITRAQLELKQKVMNIYRGDPENPIAEEEAFEELLREAKDEAIFLTFVTEVSREQLLLIADRISKQTLAAETLKQIQSALGGDRSDAYLDIFIRPRYVNSELTKILAEQAGGPNVIQEQRRKAEEYITALKAGKEPAEINFSTYYQATLLPKGHTEFSEEDGSQIFPVSLFREPVLTELQDAVKTKSVGDTLDIPYPVNGAYAAIKIEEIKEDGTYTLGLLFEPLKNIQELYAEQTRKLDVDIMALKFK